MRRFYLDTSAYLAILLGESEAPALAREIDGGELVSSVLLILEAHRNLIRMTRDGTLSVEQYHVAVARLESDLEVFAIRELSLDLCANRSMPVVSTPRSLDLAHLRTALWFHERAPLTRFVSLDQAQARAAAEFGLPI